MAREEAKVRVRLDTRQAKSELRGLTRSAAATAGRVGTGIRSAVGRGLGIVGLGGGVGIGLGAVKAATSSGFADVIGEALGGIAARCATKVLGEGAVQDARASKTSRDETIQAFGLLTQGGTQVPPGAMNYFNQIKVLHLEKEKVAQMFREDDNFRGPKLDEVIKKIMTALGTLLSEAIDTLASKLIPFGD